MDTLSYTYSIFKQRARDCGDKPDSECTVVNIKYPVFTNQKVLNDSVKRKLITLFWRHSNNTADISLKKYADDFIRDYEQDTIRDPDGPWKIESSAKVLLQDSSLVTLYFAGEIYDGAAHGRDGYSFINWDTGRSRIIRLTDLFDQGILVRLTKIVEKKFRKKDNLSDTASLINYPYYSIKDGVFILPSNFLITKKGITFLYNEEELDAWSEGTPQFDIPYAQIKSLLRPNTVVAQYIK